MQGAPADGMAFLLGNAIALQRQGRLPEALALYDAVLAGHPRHFAALLQRGNILAAQNRPEAAAAFEAALALDPADVEARNNLGNALHAQGREEEALAHLRLAHAARPDSPQIATNLGNVLVALQRPGEAIALFEASLPHHAARLGLGTALAALGRREEAIVHLEAAGKGNVAALRQLAANLAALGRHAEALPRWREALALEPDHAATLAGLGNGLCALRGHEAGLAAFDAALALAPDLAEAQRGRGHALQALERADEALAAFDAALALRPRFADAQHGRGHVLQSLGRLAEAQAAFEAAVALAPGRPDVYNGLAQSRRFREGDPHLPALRGFADRIGSYAPPERMALHFTLGKVLGDLGEHRASIGHYIEGNARKRATIDYREAATLAMFRRIAQIFTPELLRAKAGQGDPSNVPVFILGMPRSGTTLVEQMLASHPDVHGAGELGHIHRAARAMQWPDGRFAFPDIMPFVSAGQLAQIGAAYLALLPAGKARVTDKMPENFPFAGLIHLALPNARIIHMRRDPVDTCLSCFSKLFTGEQAHTYDLAELGRYWRGYDALMAHWRAALPPGVMLEVQYETLVADFEVQSRAILAHCGLGWDDACLRFHETDRPVRTASMTQVRQPLYQSAVGRWLPHRDMLAPLLRELGPAGGVARSRSASNAQLEP